MRALLALLPAATLIGLAALAADAQAQHHGSHAAPDTAGVAETFVVSGLRVDAASLPPGSGVGRAGLRFADGGYVSVVYGKPYARGRVLWGGLVAWDAVWAAGAHRATELVTTVPLAVGGGTLAPGAYSLLVTPRDGAPWTLHVNRRLGAHLADEYRPDEDLVTVDAMPAPLAQPADGLVWVFAEDGSALVLSWGDRAVAFPLSRP